MLGMRFWWDCVSAFPKDFNVASLSFVQCKRVIPPDSGFFSKSYSIYSCIQCVYGRRWVQVLPVSPCWVRTRLTCLITPFSNIVCSPLLLIPPHLPGSHMDHKTIINVENLNCERGFSVKRQKVIRHFFIYARDDSYSAHHQYHILASVGTHGFLDCIPLILYYLCVIWQRDFANCFSAFSPNIEVGIKLWKS